jgi:amino acid adenylation domain-containing protein
MPNISDQLADLSPTKRALFETILKASREAPEPTELAPIATLVHDRDHRYDPFPLTDMQQAYWVGRSGAISLGMATHMYEEIEIEDLDFDRLTRAWRQLVERHDILRAIVLPNGTQQVLERVPEYTIAVTDMRHQSQDEVTAHLVSTRDRMGHQALASDVWPLFELHATRLGDRRYRIHVSMDGLLLDGWSYQILFREWIERYENPETPVVPFEVTFRDYVLAELAGRESDAFKTARAYWDRRLPTLPPPAELPTVHSSESLWTAPFVRRKSRIEAPIFDKLKARAVRHAMSVPAVLIAAYTEVLTTWSRHPRFTLSVGRFNRVQMHPDVNHLLGEFASFSLLEVDNGQGGSFAVRVKRQQEQMWRDLDHSQVSGVELLRDLHRMTGRGTDVLMPIVFTLMPHEVLAGSAVSLGLADRSVYGLTQTSQLWLDCQCGEDGGALAFNWDSVDEMFPPGLLDDMFGAYERLLHRLAEDDTIWQEERPQLVPKAQLEQRALVNATDAPIVPQLLQELFAERARLQPSAPAVVAGSVTLTYADLARRVRCLAAELRRRGLKPNTLAAIVMEKGPEQVIAALATVCAGGAYLPIDPSLPAERFEYLLEHGQAVVALTQPWLEEILPWPDALARIPIAIAEDDGADAPALEPVNTQDDLAYVIYTSGSTGLPKGVMVTQRGVVNAVLATNARFDVTSRDRVLALTALHHDMSVYDIFGVLAAGGTMVMPAAQSTRDPAAWLELMATEQVTIWNSVPAFMQMLIEYASAQQLTLAPSLRLAFLGGDWIPVTLPGQLAALNANTKLVSVGGPTETTLWNIWYPVEQVDPGWKSIPYGRPIANNRYAVLNEVGGECPVWVPGVLHCSGAGVARGYWRDDALTASAFFVQPQTGVRLYRTGDVGRFLPDGTLEFMGRADFQVKIQGMRVELGEIEAALLAHPLVRGAVVTISDDGGSKGPLTGHVVLDAAAAGGSASLGDFVDPDSGQLDGVLFDPRERLAFKLGQHGLRRFEPDANAIALTPLPQDKNREAAYAARRSYRQFQQKALALEVFSEFLGALAQMTFEGMPVPKYRYASGGGLYPVQTYLHVKPNGVDGLAAGTYYYAPKEHQLVLLTASAPLDRALHIASNQAAFDMASFSVFFVADLEAILPMYGQLARDICLMEAGAMGLLLMQEAAPHGIGLCPIGAVRFTELRSAFELKETHVLLHSLIGGAVDVAQTLPSGLVAEGSAVAAAETGADASDRHPALAALPAFLKRKLPAHMVPVSFVEWEALPLTPNGKVDRKALLAKGKGATPAAASHTPPRNDLETRIAETWQTVLGVDQVGIHDNFFDIGGNSLKLVLIHSVLQDSLQREINIVTLFQFPTIAALAESLSGETEAPSLEEPASRAELRAQSRRERAGAEA